MNKPVEDMTEKEKVTEATRLMLGDNHMLPEDQAHLTEMKSLYNKIKAAIEDGMLKEGTHYGKLKSSGKNSLWQPGAEVIRKICEFRVLPSDVTPTRGTDHAGDPCIDFLVVSRVANRQGELVGEGMAFGSTSGDMEKRKSRGNPANIAHNVIMMTKKRAFVAAVRNAAAVSEFFTQDDDLEEYFTDEKKETKPKENKYAPKKKEKEPMISDDQANELFAYVREDRMAKEDATDLLFELGYSSSKAVPASEFEKVKKAFETKAKQIEGIPA